VAIVVPPTHQSDAGNPRGDDVVKGGGDAIPAGWSYVSRPTAAHPATGRTPPWRTFVLVGGHPVGVRQLEPTDAPKLMDAFRHLSPASRGTAA